MNTPTPEQLEHLVQLDHRNQAMGFSSADRIRKLLEQVESTPRGWRGWFVSKSQPPMDAQPHFSQCNRLALESLLQRIQQADRGNDQLDSLVCQTLLKNTQRSRLFEHPTTTLAGAYMLQQHLVPLAFVRISEMAKAPEPRWQANLGLGGGIVGVNGYAATHQLAIVAAVIKRLIHMECLRNKQS